MPLEDQVINLIQEVASMKSVQVAMNGSMIEIKEDIHELLEREHCNHGEIHKLKGKVEVMEGTKLPLSIKIALIISMLSFAATVISQIF